MPSIVPPKVPHANPPISYHTAIAASLVLQSVSPLDVLRGARPNGDRHDRAIGPLGLRLDIVAAADKDKAT